MIESYVAARNRYLEDETDGDAFDVAKILARRLYESGALHVMDDECVEGGIAVPDVEHPSFKFKKYDCTEEGIRRVRQKSRDTEYFRNDPNFHMAGTISYYTYGDIVISEEEFVEGPTLDTVFTDILTEQDQALKDQITRMAVMRVAYWHEIADPLRLVPRQCEAVRDTYMEKMKAFFDGFAPRADVSMGEEALQAAYDAIEEQFGSMVFDEATVRRRLDPRATNIVFRSDSMVPSREEVYAALSVDKEGSVSISDLNGRIVHIDTDTRDGHYMDDIVLLLMTLGVPHERQGRFMRAYHLTRASLGG